MRQYVEPFIQGQIASEREEEDLLFYEDAQGQLLAEVYHHDGQFCSGTFYGQGDLNSVTKEQVIAIAERAKKMLGQDHLQLQSVARDEGDYLVEFRRIEPKYGLLVQGVGLFVTVTDTGFVESVTLHEDDIEICYPEKMISKEEARAILKQQPIMQLGIAREMGWQYTYKPNYDLFGVHPDGKVQLSSDDEMVREASFEPLPKVEAITDLEAFIKGGRVGELDFFESADEKSWTFETEDDQQINVDVFTRACQIVQYLVGDVYEHYHFVQLGSLRELLGMDEQAFEVFSFVYIFEGIAFDFEGITISVNKETNQISSIRYPLIPFEKFPTLQKPTITLEEANAIAAELIDVELGMQNELVDSKKRTFVYNIDYPTSPTGAHIQFVDAFTGEVHWIDNR